MTVPTTTEQVLAFTEEHIISRLDTIAEHLGIAGAYTWEQLVRITFAEGLFGIVFAVLLLLLTGGIGIIAHHLYKKAVADEWKSESTFVPFLVSSLCFLGTTIGAFINLYESKDDFLRVIAPEAFLLREVLGVASSAVGL